jgi:hypothetical protein
VTIRKICMIWLEIISIRTAGAIETERIFEICGQCCQCNPTGQLLKLIVYRSARYETDISIHLHWKSDPGPGSILGLEVISALDDLGLISHTSWVKQEEFIAGVHSETTLAKTTSNMDTS